LVGGLGFFGDGNVESHGGESGAGVFRSDGRE
jgi:hypothetical protein